MSFVLEYKSGVKPMACSVTTKEREKWQQNQKKPICKHL